LIDLVYTWGSMSFKGTPIYRQAQPYQQPAQNTISVACGSSHVAAVDAYGDVFMLGSNEHGQLGLEGELHAKTFKKLNTDYIGKVRRAVCISEATFLITRDEELFFTGRISHNRNGRFT
jgi:alpha-tubulin suppressor-like RCC1 family protein